jgi:RNA-binding protein YhbY
LNFEKEKINLAGKVLESNRKTLEVDWQQLMCIVCFELPRDAMECDQCHNLMCEACHERWVTHKKGLFHLHGSIPDCPVCRVKPLRAVPSHQVRRIVEPMLKNTKPCVNNCGVEVQVKDVRHHLQICQKRIIKCKMCKVFAAEKTAFLEHLLAKHQFRIIEQFGENVIKEQEEMVGGSGSK